MHKYTHEERVTLRTTNPFANVRDEFKDMTTEEIQSELSGRSSDLWFLFENALRDFNFGGIIRASNAFACAGVMYTGFRKYDPRGSVGSQHYTVVHHWQEEDFDYVINRMRKDGHRLVVAESDAYANSINLVDYQWQPKTLLMLGEEGVGVSQKYLDMADDVVYIPQLGSVRSLNTACAANILAYDFNVKTGRL